MKFILPSRVPQFDFQFQVLASKDYWDNFKHNPLDIVYAEDYPDWDSPLVFRKWKNYCPVGSLEFCRKCGVETLPRNIPPQLIKYAVGIVTDDITNPEYSNIKKWHIKSSTKIKDPDNGVYVKNDKTGVYSKGVVIPVRDYQAVEYIEEGFDAEYRVFVCYGNIVDMQNYAGDFWKLPDKSTVEHMIYDFEHARGVNVPPAYTLDVGIYNGKTYVIEVHDFYSCGSYNFNDHYRLPMMLQAWYNWYSGLNRNE